MLDHYERFADLCSRFQVPYIVFNDHIPHAALAAGKRPPRLTGQALKSGRNPDAHLGLLKQMHDAHGQVPAALLRLRTLLSAHTILGSHDDRSAQQRQNWAQMGVSICEFPETYEVAKLANALGSPVVMGAPNLLRGGSHKGNISVATLLAEGLCDALASDYHYPSLCHAALSLEADIGIAKAWALISSRPAKILGLGDRGHLALGQRADMVVLDRRSHAVEGTFAQGRPVHLTGGLAARMTGLVSGDAHS
jgi:alpha-D-ribose 1-methylphosphonate 5-triphosphate diphosphatase